MCTRPKLYRVSISGYEEMAQSTLRSCNACICGTALLVIMNKAFPLPSVHFVWTRQ